MHIIAFNPLTAKLIDLNFHPLEVVSRWRDPQPEVRKIIQIWQNGGQLFSNVAGWCHILSLTNVVLDVLIKNEYPNICDTGG